MSYAFNRAEVKAGEAAKYGIFYDDRKYDYTQHLKPIGKTPGAVFVAATASTIEHDSTGAEIVADPVAAETAINKATYEKIHQTDADPAVLEVLEALDDEAYIDEDEFEDDFIVKLDRQEIRVLAPVLSKKGGKGDRNLDKDFQKMLQMYDGEIDVDDLSFDEEYEEVEEYYSDGEDASVDVVGMDDAKPFSRGGPSRLYQVDEVRRELRDGPSSLLDRILYTTDDESGDEKAAEIIEIDALNLHTKIMNCQNACEFLTAGTHKLNRPKLIREESNKSVKPIRISRKTGMPVQEDQEKEEEPQGRKATFEEEPVNKGVPRNKEETAEEKRARKAAIKEERRERRVQKKANTA